MGPKIYPSSPTCERCGFIKGEHIAVNYSDEQFVSSTIFLCPTVVFKEKLKNVKEKKDPKL